MHDKPSDLNALVGSRICHDLISPLGAIGNGVELMTMSGMALSPEMALIAESVENANARIRFFRVAFGAAADGQSIGTGEIRAILNDITQGGRLQIKWSAEGDLPRADAKLIFLLIMCFESAMPFGGTITVTYQAGQWRLNASADKLRINTHHWEAISNPNSGRDMSPADVHFALVPFAVQRVERAMAVEIDENGIRIRV